MERVDGVDDCCDCEAAKIQRLYRTWKPPEAVTEAKRDVSARGGA